MNLLKEKKEFYENDKTIQGIGDDSSFKNLGILRLAVHSLTEDNRFPEKWRMVLRSWLGHLSPIMETSSDSLTSYTNAIRNVLGILDTMFTREVSATLHAYAAKIFIPPAEYHKKHPPKP